MVLKLEKRCKEGTELFPPPTSNGNNFILNRKTTFSLLQQDLTHKHSKVSKHLCNKGKEILVEIFPLHEKQKANKYINKSQILLLNSVPIII